MYRRIVVGTDGSPSALRAVRRAADLARGASDDEPRPVVHVVSAHPSLSDTQLEQIRAVIPDGLSNQVAADMSATAALADAGQLLEDAGVTYETSAVEDDAVPALLSAAASFDADLLVVGSRGLAGTTTASMGSVSARLSEKAPIDLLVVKAPVRLDTDDEDDEEEQTVTSNLGRLSEAFSRFEADHPDLVKTINDVSYYLSGIGI